MTTVIKPKGYHATLNVKETEEAIKLTRDYFKKAFSEELNLSRVSSPLFLKPETGLNDNLNGIEQAVSFNVKGAENSKVEIVHSLAKWKRMALNNYGFNQGEGIYTNMNAIRAEEELSNLHSIYVDQWDWEKIIAKEERTEKKLHDVVRQIYKVFKEIECYLSEKYSYIEPILPDEISFITTQELENKYPHLTPKERENAIAKERKAVFISKIGDQLQSGIKHDGRSPDYDDWQLNGDIIFWYPVLDKAFEVSSMGIRVDRDSLLRQIKAAHCEERLELEYHKMILEDELPYTIGGGIGQSRVCMFLLRKAHIGEVQASVWSKEIIDECKRSGIQLL
ncbi:aspartate--ammonia ligase [Bacillus shivajii]|uniref:aspartate--ammonia ligase n=1 Tax=Bacillus shivajii TaxID=1983719 RepID=UPI001CF97345|nr:aspartate--ammonia ligase [Bacillus shivajii]UCZ55303.1 aspartate--ammonia ligase [Bacillus shivajii]